MLIVNLKYFEEKHKCVMLSNRHAAAGAILAYVSLNNCDKFNLFLILTIKREQTKSLFLTTRISNEF